MALLSTVGVQGTFPIIGQATVCIYIGQVASDNLALNSLLGFVESFSGDFYCTFLLNFRLYIICIYFFG
jgi:hypothetical protein